GGLPRGAALRPRPGRSRVRADRAAAAGMGQPGGARAADRRTAASGCLRVVGVAGQRSDASARSFPAAELLGWQRGDVFDVCGARDPVLLPRPLSAADRRLLAAAEWARDVTGDDRDVLP